MWMDVASPEGELTPYYNLSLEIYCISDFDYRYTRKTISRFISFYSNG